MAYDKIDYEFIEARTRTIGIRGIWSFSKKDGENYLRKILEILEVKNTNLLFVGSAEQKSSYFEIRLCNNEFLEVKDKCDEKLKSGLKCIVKTNKKKSTKEAIINFDNLEQMQAEIDWLFWYFDYLYVYCFESGKINWSHISEIAKNTINALSCDDWCDSVSMYSLFFDNEHNRIIISFYDQKSIFDKFKNEFQLKTNKINMR